MAMFFFVVFCFKVKMNCLFKLSNIVVFCLFWFIFLFCLFCFGVGQLWLLWTVFVTGKYGCFCFVLFCCFVCFGVWQTSVIKASFRLSAKIDFCANPIEIRSYLDSLNGNELHEIRFVQIRFELHSYAVWNPIQITFLEIRFSLTGQIGFSVAFSCPHAT